MKMDRFSERVISEFKMIEEDCMAKGILATEWIEKYAENFHERYWNVKPREVVVGSYSRYKEERHGSL